MEFIDEENKKVFMSTYSKSFGEIYEECPLKAWYKIRNKKAFISSNALELGKYAHALFATEVGKFTNQEYYINDEELTADPTIRFEAKTMLRRINLDKFISSPDEVIGFEKIVKHTVNLSNKEQLEIMGIFDLIMFKDSPRGSYIEVFDFKTGFKIEKKVDLQCMIYVYLAAKLYPGFPIYFHTYSGRTGDEWGKYFSEKDALSMEEDILEHAEKIKKEVESDYSPIAKAGAHCQNCPFLSKCSSNQVDLEEANIETIFTSYMAHKAEMRKCEDKLKSFRINNPKDEGVDTGAGFVVDYSESLSVAIATPKTSKKDLLLLFAVEGMLPEILDSLDINFTDKVIAKAKTLNIDFKPKITKRLTIKNLADVEGVEDEE